MIITRQIVRDRLFFNGPSTILELMLNMGLAYSYHNTLYDMLDSLIVSDSITCIDGVYYSKLNLVG